MVALGVMLMDASTYRDMHLLNELTHTPGTTQRELARRIGVALGLTNLMLRRLAKKGYVKIAGTKRNRIRYLITPKGILEKTRLTYEYLECSLQLYSRARHFLREHLAKVAQSGQRRIVLYGIGEMAEIAALTIVELGLELVAVVERAPRPAPFLGHPVQALSELAETHIDRVVICALRGGADELEELNALSHLAPRLIILPLPGLLKTLPGALEAGNAAALPIPTLTTPESVAAAAPPA